MNSVWVLNPSRSWCSLHLWKATPMFTLVLFWAMSNSFFCAFFSFWFSSFYSCTLLLVMDVLVVVSLLMVVAPPLLSLSSWSCSRRCELVFPKQSWGGGRGRELSVAYAWAVIDSCQTLHQTPGSDWFFLFGLGGFWPLRVFFRYLIVYGVF